MAGAFVVFLSLISFQGSLWSDAQIQNQLRELSATYAQCGIEIRPTLHILADPKLPRRLRMSEDHSPGSYREIAHATAHIPRPAVYFVDGVSDDDIVTSFSRADFTNQIGDPYPAFLHDTVWLIHHVTTPEYAREQVSPYSVLAHELTHVFTRDGQHNNDAIPNLMTRPSRRKNDLSAALCAEILRHPSIYRGDQTDSIDPLKDAR